MHPLNSFSSQAWSCLHSLDRSSLRLLPDKDAACITMPPLETVKMPGLPRTWSSEPGRHHDGSSSVYPRYRGRLPLDFSIPASPKSIYRNGTVTSDSFRSFRVGHQERSIMPSMDAAC